MLNIVKYKINNDNREIVYIILQDNSFKNKKQYILNV